MNEYALLCLYWAAFYGFHSLLASLMAKKIIQKFTSFTDTNYRLFYNLFAVLSLGWVLYYQGTLPVYLLVEKTLVAQGLALVFIFSSVSVMWLAFKSYSMREFMGLKAEKTQASAQLSISGLNEWVRHPLYLGVLLGLVAVLLWEASLKNALAATVLLAYLFIGIYLEEQKLLIYFGEDYRRYQRKTKRIIPFVW